MLGLPTLRVAREGGGRVVEELVAGLNFVRRHPRLRLILPVFAVANLFVLGLNTVAIPLFVKVHLGAGAQGLGIMSGSFGLGLVVGTVVMGRFPRATRETLAGLFVLFALSDAALATVGLAPNLVVACVAFSCSGFFIGPASTLYQATLQRSTPPEFLGRVTGLARGVSFGLEPVSASVVGGLSRAVASGTILVAGGLAATTTDLFALVRGRRQDEATAAARRFGPSPGTPPPFATALPTAGHGE
jgi:MFS family permease